MFYNQDTNIPQPDTICFVKLSTKYNIKSNDLGLYVNLVDYGMIEGYIPLTELTKWRVNIQKILKYDKIYPCIVHSIDKEIVNLSYYRIKEEERERLLNQFEYAQRINSMCELVKSKKLIESHMYNDSSIEELYKLILENPELYFSSDVIDTIKSKITIEPYESLKEFKLIICEDDGINKLKKILGLFQEYISNTDNIDKNNIMNCSIECVSSPIYAIRMKHLNIDESYITTIFNSLQEIIDNEYDEKTKRYLQIYRKKV